MHEYLFDIELSRLALVLGIVVGLLVYEYRGITMGGVIVPGYLALFVPRPVHILVTLAIAILTYYIVHYVIMRRVIIYGRLIFEIEILVGFLLQAIWTMIVISLSHTTSELSLLLGIGFVMPGVIAHDFSRQGLVKGLQATLFGTLIVFVLILFIELVRDLLPQIFDLLPSPILRAQPYAYGYPKELLLLGVGLSVVGGMLIFHKLNLRTGGFVVPAYLALFAIRPLDLLFVAGCFFLTYVLVTGVAMRATILFGRTKLGIMVLVGVVIAWWGEILVTSVTSGQFVPWSGFAIIMPMIVALLANDAERQGPTRTLAGVMLGTLWVLAGVQLLILGWNFIQPA